MVAKLQVSRPLCISANLQASLAPMFIYYNTNRLLQS